MENKELINQTVEQILDLLKQLSPADAELVMTRASRIGKDENIIAGVRFRTIGDPL